MILRISLIVAILAGLGALGLSQFKVAPLISELRDNLDQTSRSLAQTKTTADNAQKALGKTTNALNKATSDLATTLTTLQATTAKASEQEKLAQEKAAQLEETTKKYNENRQALAQWIATGIQPNQVDDLKREREAIAKERDMYALEKVILARNNRQKDAELSRYTPAGSRPPEMPGLKGKIVAVDPKWEFVVLDVGGNQGAMERGELLVSRDGKFIAKVRITKVEPNRCVANVLPEWKQADLKEGDQVIY